MNDFIASLGKQIDKISSDRSIRNTYAWIFENQDSLPETVSEINSQLGLRGDYELKSDMPSFTIGSRRGTVILALNPGWNEDNNPKEDEVCRSSEQEYVDIMLNFFKEYPSKIGVRPIWWTRVIGFHLLQHGKSKDMSRDSKWKLAQKGSPAPLGGWNLIPFHSKRDGIGTKIGEVEWLNDFAARSLKAAIRCKPKQLIIASEPGYRIVREGLLSSLDWQDKEIQPKLEKRNKVRVSLTYEGDTEIIAMGAQHFSQGIICPDREMIKILKELRENHGKHKGHNSLT